MSSVADRYGVASPRTAQHPRAFTGHEFITGVFWAVLWFQPMGAAITLVIGLIATPVMALGYTVAAGFVGLPVSIAAALVGSPGAFVFGRALSAESRDRIHLVVFAAYGVAVGLVTVVASGLVVGGSPSAVWLLAPYALAAGVAVPLGWWKASRGALAAEAEQVAPSRETSAE